MEEKKSKQYVLKKTKSREEILNILKRANKPLCAEDIIKQMKSEVNQSTVYRTLTAYVAKDIIMKVVMDNQIAYYEIAKTHRHSIFCKNCNEILVIDDCPLDKVLSEIKEKTGYEITGHSLEISGICSKCREKEEKENKEKNK